MKKRNPTDVTERNVRAAKKREAAISRTMKVLQGQVRLLTRALKFATRRKPRRRASR